MRYLTIAFASMIFSSYCNAIAVSSLLVNADPKTHSAEITIVNNDGKDMFINLEMAKVDYIKGKKVVTKINEKNFKNWTFSITPSQMILKEGQRKTVRLYNKCSNDKCERDKDDVYAVDITPVPYSEGKAALVAVAFGYRTYFIDPATAVDLKYSIHRVGKSKFEFINDSNTMLNAVINYCDKEFRSNCISQNRLLPNAKKTFDLPEAIKNNKVIKAIIINADESINEEVSF